MASSERRLLKRLHATGYRSFREIDIELGPVNILIGANGTGKSNFINLFKFLRQVARQELQLYVEQASVASMILHHGPKVISIYAIWFLNLCILFSGG